MANGDGDSNGRFAGYFGLDNKVILLLIAAILGIPANQAFQQFKPDAVRPDPFTGTQALQMKTELVDRIIDVNQQSQDRHDNQEIRISKLESMQALDNQHRVRADKGWELIREMREDIAVIKEKLNTLEKQHREHN